MKLSDLNYINSRISSELKFDPEILIDTGDGKAIPFEFANVECNLGDNNWKIVLSETRYRKDVSSQYNLITCKDCVFFLDIKDENGDYITGQLGDLDIFINREPMRNTRGM